MLGVLGVALWLIPALGLGATVIVCAAMNFACAALALGLFAQSPATLPVTPRSARRDGIVALAASGFLGIGYEVLVVRVLNQVAENTIYTFAILLAVYLVGTALGAVTGMLIAPLNYLDPGMMGDVAIKAFAAAVLGGITSLPGAVLGGMLLGVIDSVVGYQAAELRTTIAFVLIVVVLVLRPGGMLGRHVIKKV